MPYAQLAADVRAVVADTLEHFNANHADTVLLLARHAAGVRGATDAEAVSVDAHGVDLEVRIGAAHSTARIAFPVAVTRADEVTDQVMALVGQARTNAGERFPITSLERELDHNGSLLTHVAEVLDTRELTPNLREIVVGGAGLAAFESRGGDQFAYVFVPRPGDELPASYSMAEWMAADHDTRPYGAYYTIRTYDPAAGRLVLWAVVHGHADGVGGWFARCRPGARLALWGPREGFWSDGAYAAADAGRHHLFVSDESGWCAVAALLERLDAADTATVLAETVDASHQIEFPGLHTTVRWHHRGATEPGVGSGLYDLVAELASRPGVPIATAFGAGESRQMSRIRKFLRHQIGMPATRVSMTGYWRRSASPREGRRTD